jgi:hypothetical protein
MPDRPGAGDSSKKLNMGMNQGFQTTDLLKIRAASVVSGLSLCDPDIAHFH